MPHFPPPVFIWLPELLQVSVATYNMVEVEVSAGDPAGLAAAIVTARPANQDLTPVDVRLEAYVERRFEALWDVLTN